KDQAVVGQMILVLWNASNGFYDSLCTEFFRHHSLHIVIQATRILSIMCSIVEPEFLQTRDEIDVLIGRARQGDNMVLRTYSTDLSTSVRIPYDISLLRCVGSFRFGL
ncbi:hypothetical protein SARC_10492, partial [Sphaeroforma arctica JP610]